MASETYAPIPNERAIIAAMRRQWHAVSGTAAYRAGIATTITVVNGKGARRITVQPSAVGTFEDEGGTT
jgi:hypothetical protein